MPCMRSYVTRNAAGTLRGTGSRVSLASLVHAFWRGEAPETIVLSFPTLSLEQVNGAIAWYLARREEVDREIEALEREIENGRTSARERNRELRDRILKARGGP